MIALLEGMWYSFLIILKVSFWPIIILLGVTILARLYGLVKRSIKDNKDKNK